MLFPSVILGVCLCQGKSHVLSIFNHRLLLKNVVFLHSIHRYSWLGSTREVLLKYEN